MRDFAKATLQELASDFEGDIHFDAHALSARIRRSLAGRELVKRGQSSVAFIREKTNIVHAKRHDTDICIAWRALENELLPGPGCDVASGPCACGAWHFPKAISE